MSAQPGGWSADDLYYAPCPDCGHEVNSHGAYGCSLCRRATGRQELWCQLTNETVRDRVKEESQ
jgi:tRNA(Ile2) C34 agmatinyltransferase TiaS